MAILLGTGSWADDEYVGVLFPKTLPAKERLRGYAEHFNFVEVNSTYYSAPKSAVVDNWIRLTPPQFTFDLKLHRAFSQSPSKAAQRDDLVEKYCAAAKQLADEKKFGAFFLVADPRFTPERHQLDEFDLLAEKLAPYPLAIELRRRDWVEGERREQTLNYFRQRKLIWIAVDFPQIKDSRLMPAVDEVTHPEIAYLRLHGRNPNYLEAESAAEGHTYLYTPKEIAALAERVEILAGDAEKVHVVCNNHALDYAPRTALALKQKLRLENSRAV